MRFLKATPLILFLTFLLSAETYGSQRNVAIGGVVVVADCEASCQNKFSVSDKFEFSGFRIAESATLEGSGTILYDGNLIDASFSNGFFASSPVFLFDKYAYGDSVDKYEGTLDKIYDPYWKIYYDSFNEGSYVMPVGAKFEGRFFIVPKFDFFTGNGCIQRRRGKEVSKKEIIATLIKWVNFSDASERVSCALADVVFVGSLEYKGKSQIGVFSQQNYKPGSRLRLDYTNEDSLKLFRLNSEKNLQQFASFEEEEARRIERERKKYDVPWGKIFSILAGAMITQSSSLNNSQKVDFFSSYTKDVFSNSTENMSALANKYRNPDSRNTSSYDPFKVIRELNANTDRMIADFNASQQRQKPGAYGCKAGTVWNVQLSRCLSSTQASNTSNITSQSNYIAQTNNERTTNHSSETRNDAQPRVRTSQNNAVSKPKTTNKPKQSENEQRSSGYEGKIYAIVPAYERGKGLPVEMQDYKRVVEDPSYFPVREVTREGAIRPGLWYYFRCNAEWSEQAEGALIPGRVNGTFYTSPQATGLASRPSRSGPSAPKNIWDASYTGSWLSDRFSEHVKRSINSGNVMGLDLKDMIEGSAAARSCYYTVGFTKEDVDKSIESQGNCKLGGDRKGCYHLSFDATLENHGWSAQDE